MTREAPAPRLSTDRIVAAARTIARTDGIDAVSMRRLAEELDVWPMSVYRHFRDKDDLLDAVVGSAAAEVPAPDPATPWREQLAELARGTRTTLGPGRLGARLPEAALTPGALALSETGVGILTAAGFAPEEAARGWHLLLGYACARPPHAPAAAARAALAGLPEAEYPALSAAAGPLASALGDESAAFEHGLEVLLDGLERRLSTPAA